MYPRRAQRKILPKISTLPRQRTEAAHYLDLYKLTVEKKRLQQELQSLEERQQQIKQRLEELDVHTIALDEGAQQLRDVGTGQASAPTSNVYLPSNRSVSTASTTSAPDDFNLLFLEY
ncbi:MAG: hypothetical protein ICV62_05700 [Cyanobacteria bacterium Co-bin13]|nr:hypothetical protein [Cyanobacteria bacterium Co-bin13]